MVNTAHTQSEQNVFQRQSFTAKSKQPRSGVRQDNPTPPRDRTASPQPASPKNKMRPHPFDVDTELTRPGRPRQRQTISHTIHLKLRVSAALKRKAEEQGLSVSATAAALIEWALQQSMYEQNAATLETAIDKAIGKHMRAYSNRHAALLVRSLFAAEQARIFAYNILGRQSGMSDEELTDIKTNAQHSARANITRITPQMQTLVEAVTHWLMEEVNASG